MNGMSEGFKQHLGFGTVDIGIAKQPLKVATGKNFNLL